MQHKCAVVVQVLVTQWNQCYPCKTKSDEKPSKFPTPRINPISIYTYNSLEFIRACKELNWNHERSTPRRSETKEMAERAVPRVKEDTSPVLVQSGLQESWWAEAMECHCYLRNSQDLPADGQTPMTAAIHCCLPSGDDLRQEFEETYSEEEKKARDPSPDPTARQDFWCIMKIACIRMLLLRGRNSMFRMPIFRYVRIIWMFRDKNEP